MAATPSFDERERYLRELAGFLEIPSVSRDPAPAADMRARPPSGSRRSSPSRAAASWRPTATPRCSPSGSARPGRRRSSSTATTTCSRRATRPSGRRRRSRRACATAASTRAARPTTRGRCSSRSKVAAGVPRGDGRAAAQRALPDRGRGGDRQPEPRPPSSRRTATSSLPTSSSRPTGRCGGPTEPSVAIAAKGLVALDLIVTRPAQRPALGPPRRRRPESEPRARPRSSRACTTPDGAVAVAGFYDDVVPLSAADRDALARVPFDEEAYRAAGRRAGAARRAGLHDARAALDAADARGERLRRAAAPSRSSPRRARAHITCRLVPGQRPEAVLAAVTRHVEAHVPRGVEVRVEAASGRRARLRDRGRAPGGRGRRPRRSARSTPTASRCSCASAGRSPRRCSSSRCSA